MKQKLVAQKTKINDRKKDNLKDKSKFLIAIYSNNIYYFLFSLHKTTEGG
jgi:hypothetical protein